MRFSFTKNPESDFFTKNSNLTKKLRGEGKGGLAGHALYFYQVV